MRHDIRFSAGKAFQDQWMLIADAISRECAVENGLGQELAEHRWERLLVPARFLDTSDSL